MKLHRQLLTALLFLCLNSTAYAFCKLNIRGDSLCLGQEALHQKNVSKDVKSEPEYQVVEIVEMNYPKVTVKKDREEFVVSVDSLIGAQECSAGDHVCEEDRVRLNESCSLSAKRSLKVEKVFKNEMIQAKLRTIPLLQKTRKMVVPVDCVDDVF